MIDSLVEVYRPMNHPPKDYVLGAAYTLAPDNGKNLLFICNSPSGGQLAHGLKTEDYARRWGFNRWYIVYLWPYLTDSVIASMDHSYPTAILQERDSILKYHISRCDVSVAVWGSFGKAEAARVLNAYPSKTFQCLGFEGPRLPISLHKADPHATYQPYL